jgi:hypothetical protein
MNAKVIVAVIVLLALSGGYILIKNQKADISKIPSISLTEIATPSPTISVTQNEEPKITQITLTVASPVNGSTATGSQVTVKGKTLPKAEVYANEAEGFADVNGNFSLLVNLDEGSNEIIVTAVDSEGNVAETVVTVNYNVE